MLTGSICNIDVELFVRFDFGIFYCDYLNGFARFAAIKDQSSSEFALIISFFISIPRGTLVSGIPIGQAAGRCWGERYYESYRVAFCGFRIPNADLRCWRCNIVITNGASASISRHTWCGIWMVRLTRHVQIKGLVIGIHILIGTDMNRKAASSRTHTNGLFSRPIIITSLGCRTPPYSRWSSSTSPSETYLWTISQ